MAELQKGVFGGLCNRSACLRPGADWHNIATDAYYCRECAELINWPGGRADALRLHGRELLCMPVVGRLTRPPGAPPLTPELGTALAEMIQLAHKQVSVPNGSAS